MVVKIWEKQDPGGTLRVLCPKKTGYSAKISTIGAAGLAFVAAVAITSCGSGQIAQTSSEVAAVDGVNADVGTIAIRNAMVAHPSSDQGFYPMGSSVPIIAVIVNSGAQEDHLVSVRSPLTDNTTTNGDLTVRPHIALQTGLPQSSHTQITLVDVNRTIGPGQKVPVSFLFQRAGEITVQLPIAVSNESS